MKPSLSAFTLVHFAQELAHRIHQVPELGESLTVRCVLNRGKLMFLIEHPPESLLQAEYGFAHLEKLIRQAIKTRGLPEEVSATGTDTDELPIQIYLKRQNHQRPWAIHNFRWNLTDGFADVFGEPSLAQISPDSPESSLPDTLPDTLPDQPIALIATDEAQSVSQKPQINDPSRLTQDREEDNEDWISDESLVAGLNPFESSIETADQEAAVVDGTEAAKLDVPTSPDLLPADELTLEIEEQDQDLEAQAEALWDGELRLEEPEIDTPDIAAVDEEDVLSQSPEPRRETSKTRLIAAGVFGAILVGGLGYVVTRPCVLGNCDRIDKAQALGDAALVELGNSPSPQTVLDMRDQLRGAVKQLRPIPVWSFHHQKAQGILSTYQSEVSDLDSVIGAQTLATEASTASQSPPHPIDYWQEVADKWKEAISQLESIDTESQIYEEIVVPKLNEYRANLATIEGRISAEQDADDSVNQALQSALLATKQTEIANSLTTWETALQSWQTAVSQLKQIPQGTLAYGEAQKLLPEYEGELSQVRTRTRQERVADQFYNEAVRYAAEARKFETENQWTLSLLNWRDAVSQIQGIPEGTVRYQEGQNLLKTYQPSLNQAQENLRLAMRFQKAEESFVQACGATSQFCTYEMKGNKVQVTLAEGYDDLVELSITPPNQRVTPPSANNQLIVQTNRLLNEITNIGKRTQLPIELLDEGGAFIARYKPELDGYVKH